MRRTASILIYALMLVLLCALTACTRSPDPVAPSFEDFSSEPPTAAAESPMSSKSFSYLESSWAVTASAADTDAAVPANTVANPSGTWELVVLGESMTVHIGPRRYEGLLGEADDGWTYTGMVTGSNDAGEPLAGYIQIDASDTGRDSFAGLLSEYVDPVGSVPGYTAQWSVEASRQ